MHVARRMVVALIAATAAAAHVNVRRVCATAAATATRHARWAAKDTATSQTATGQQRSVAGVVRCRRHCSIVVAAVAIVCAARSRAVCGDHGDRCDIGRGCDRCRFARYSGRS